VAVGHGRLVRAGVFDGRVERSDADADAAVVPPHG